MSSTKMNKLGWLYAPLMMGSFLISGCDEPPSGVQVGSSYIEVQKNLTGGAVCDPFNSPEVGQRVNGVHGKALYWDPFWDPVTNASTTTARSVPGNIGTFIREGSALDVQLFINQLNVPTRPFDQGFQTQDGMILKTPRGNTMYEYFALQLNSVIKIGSRDTAGYYQFAILSDDGAILQMDDHGTFRPVVNNDGTHPTRFACANEAVYFDSSTRLPVKIDYYQGPRYHIAMMLMWRKVADASAASLVESQCGKSGNTYFFNPNVVPSAPSANYIGMLSRGWKVLSPDNYLLPASVNENPCATTCFSDSYEYPSWNTFTLSKVNVDPATIKVYLDGSEIGFSYSPSSNSIFLPSYRSGSGNIKIDFCVIPVGNDGGGGVVGV